MLWCGFILSTREDHDVTHASADDLLRGSVNEIVRARLGSENIVDVLVTRDEFEDDDVLTITVILSDEGVMIDEDHLLSLVRHMRPRLAEDGEMAFPVISFSTDREHRDAA